jgi:hypothetical protein
MQNNFFLLILYNSCNFILEIKPKITENHFGVILKNTIKRRKKE